MKINLLLITIFISIIIYAEINFETGHVGLTRLNGEGCLCHGIEFTDSVNVWIEGPDSLFVSDTAEYKILMTGGPAVAGGFNIAIRYGTIDSVDTLTHRMLFSEDFPLELTHTMPNPFINDTVFWSFKYTAPDSIVVDTIYSVANSVNGDGIPFDDQWNFGANFPVVVIDNPVPVELASFAANVNNNGYVILYWSTATELNNQMFEIERKSKDGQYIIIGFVNGFGTTTEPQDYSYIDNTVETGTFFYRLKQIDFLGTYEYSDEVEVEVNGPLTFGLEQNYPNPFNPATTIQYTINTGQFVSLKVYDILGNEVTTLVNEEKPTGTYQVGFNAAHLTSGVYFYKLETNAFIDVKKMILMQ